MPVMSDNVSGSQVFSYMCVDNLVYFVLVPSLFVYDALCVFLTESPVDFRKVRRSSQEILPDFSRRPGDSPYLPKHLFLP